MRRGGTKLVCGAWVAALAAFACAPPPATLPAMADSRYAVGPVIESDEFDGNGVVGEVLNPILESPPICFVTIKRTCQALDTLTS